MPESGKLITLELEARHAEIARQNLKRAGLADRVQIMIGPALDSLAALRSQNESAFDFVFIDADKVNSLEYFQSALELSRSGALIIIDNVVRKGQIIDATTDDKSVARNAAAHRRTSNGTARGSHGGPDRRRQGLRRFYCSPCAG